MRFKYIFRINFYIDNLGCGRNIFLSHNYRKWLYVCIIFLYWVAFICCGCQMYIFYGGYLPNKRKERGQVTILGNILLVLLAVLAVVITILAIGNLIWIVAWVVTVTIKDKISCSKKRGE